MPPNGGDVVATGVRKVADLRLAGPRPRIPVFHPNVVTRGPSPRSGTPMVPNAGGPWPPRDDEVPGVLDGLRPSFPPQDGETPFATETGRRVTPREATPHLFWRPLGRPDAGACDGVPQPLRPGAVARLEGKDARQDAAYDGGRPRPADVAPLLPRPSSTRTTARRGRTVRRRPRVRPLPASLPGLSPPPAYYKNVWDADRPLDSKMIRKRPKKRRSKPPCGYGDHDQTRRETKPDRRTKLPSAGEAWRERRDSRRRDEEDGCPRLFETMKGRRQMGHDDRMWPLKRESGYAVRLADATETAHTGKKRHRYDDTLRLRHESHRDGKRCRRRHEDHPKLAWWAVLGL